MLVAGVDEAGRGALAGSVFAAAVILNPNKPIGGLKDSKKLSEGRRKKLELEIKDKALSFSVAEVTGQEIDSLNILKASLLAMKRAVDGLSVKPEFVLVDGIHLPSWNYPAKSIIRGDSKIAEIAAASIMAKVGRDTEMIRMGDLFPEYGFLKHKGYPTKAHLKALNNFGPCGIHRRSFAPVSKLFK